jgi:hypothetical protein
MKITLRRLVPLFIFPLLLGGYAFTAQAEESVTQSVDLAPGWNIVSTPMILTSHTFSAPETSENFDIYLLDASKPSGWATMADLGQTEFAPLYGYFINNKTDEDQTLTFNYDTSVEPNHKLFERTFTTEGWYSIGVANASYAKTQSADREDTDNPSSILSLLEGKYDTVIDFTDDVYGTDRKSVALSDPWKAVVPGDIDELNDFRDTKGYVVYIKQNGARYNGFQNDAVPEVVVAEELHFSLSVNNPEATTIVVDEDDVTEATIFEYTVTAQGGDIELDDLWVNLQTETANLEDVIDEVNIYINGTEFNAESTVTMSTSVDFQFDVAGDIVVYEGESANVEVVVQFKPQTGNYTSYGETIQAQVTEELVANTVVYGIDGQLTPEHLTGDAVGNIHSLLSGGIVIPSDGVSTQSDTLGENDTIGEFTIEFEVTAVEDDYYITDNTALAEDNPTDGIGFLIEGGEAVVSSALNSTADEDSSGVFTVREGETETFTLTVTIDPTSAGSYRVTLAEVWYSAINNGITGAEAYVPTPASDYRTSFRSINAD